MRRVAGHAIEGTPCHFWVCWQSGTCSYVQPSVHTVHVSLETHGAIGEYTFVVAERHCASQLQAFRCSHEAQCKKWRDTWSRARGWASGSIESACLSF